MCSSFYTRRHTPYTPIVGFGAGTDVFVGNIDGYDGQPSAVAGDIDGYD